MAPPLRVVLDRSVFHFRKHCESLQRLVESGRIRVLLPDILCTEIFGLIGKADGAGLEAIRAEVRFLLSLQPEPIRPLAAIIRDELRGEFFYPITDATMLGKLQGVLTREFSQEKMQHLKEMRSELKAADEVARQLRHQKRDETRDLAGLLGWEPRELMEELRTTPEVFEAYLLSSEGIRMALRQLCEYLEQVGTSVDETSELAARWSARRDGYPVTTRTLRAWAYFYVSSHWTTKKKIRGNDQDDMKYLIYAGFGDALVTRDPRFVRPLRSILYRSGRPAVLELDELFEMFGLTQG